MIEYVPSKNGTTWLRKSDTPEQLSGQLYTGLSCPNKEDDSTASNLCLLLQKEQNVKGGEGPSGKQAVGINNGKR